LYLITANVCPEYCPVSSAGTVPNKTAETTTKIMARKIVCCMTSLYLKNCIQVFNLERNVFDAVAML